MRGGINALMFTAALATAGCVTDTDKFQIRPVADPFTKAMKAGNPAVAEGRGLLAAGSVGLAIEAFRKALREQPDSIEALAGLAECYDQMGRHDLSQAKYEAALAIAPNDPTLLRTFAASLERQGRFAEGAALRAEAANNERAEVAVLASLAPKTMTPVQARPVAAPVKVAAAASKPPAVVAMPAKVAVAPVQPAPAIAPVAQPKPASSAAQAVEERPVGRPDTPVPVQVASTPQVSRTAWAIDVAPIAEPPPTASASVTVKLPPATPPRAVAAVVTPVAAPKVTVADAPPVEPVSVEAATAQLDPPKVAIAAPAAFQPETSLTAVAPTVTVKLPPALPAVALPPQRPAAPAVRPIVAEAVAVKAGPRLQRISLGEVALVTAPRRLQSDPPRRLAVLSDPQPRWRREPAREIALGSVPKFVPLADLQRGYGVRLLNAARHEGLAARTRLALNQRGWKSVTIGNSARVRQHSLVLYSEKTEQAARRLATHFGFWLAREARPGPLTVLLGRDWATRKQARA